MKRIIGSVDNFTAPLWSEVLAPEPCKPMR